MASARFARQRYFPRRAAYFSSDIIRFRPWPARSRHTGLASHTPAIYALVYAARGNFPRGIASGDTARRIGLQISPTRTQGFIGRCHSAISHAWVPLSHGRRRHADCRTRP